MIADCSLLTSLGVLSMNIQKSACAVQLAAVSLLTSLDVLSLMFTTILLLLSRLLVAPL